MNEYRPATIPQPGFNLFRAAADNCGRLITCVCGQAATELDARRIDEGNDVTAAKVSADRNQTDRQQTTAIRQRPGRTVINSQLATNDHFAREEKSH